MRPVPPQVARKVAIGASQTLARLVRPDGRFVYRYFLDDPERPDDSYNNIRHIGAVWYLLQADAAIGPLEGVKDAALLAGDYMVEKILVPFRDEGLLCVIDQGASKLGGAGVAIATLCLLFEATGRRHYLDLAERTASFAMSQSRNDGDFIHVRQYPTGLLHTARSKYYTGQALTGLMHIFRYNKNPEILHLVERTVEALNAASYGVATGNHWIMYALEQLYLVRKNHCTLEYATQIAKNIMQETGYRKLRQSTPIACYTEALLAYERILIALEIGLSDPRRSQCLNHIQKNLRVLLKFQADGSAFVQGLDIPEVRIDYITHAGMCFLGCATCAASA